MREFKTKTPWNLVWLASYPKSGNTWFRLFLANYFNNSSTPVSLDEIAKTPIASSRVHFDKHYHLDSIDLSMDEVDQYRPAMYDAWQHCDDLLFHKVHDAYTYVDDKPLLGNPEGQAAIYFVRNPLDVAVSFAHHQARENIDRTVDDLNNPDYGMNNEEITYANQFRQKLLTWSLHVQSWQQADLPKLILRYEDMLADPITAFSRAVHFLGWPADEARLVQALECSRFDKTQAQEKITGFSEKMPHAKSFFRSGKANTYREALSEAQIQRIIAAHEPVMRLFGY